MALGEDPGVSGACGVSRSLQRKFTFLKTRRPNASAMKRPSAGRGRSLLVLRVCRDQSMTKTYSLTRVSAKNDRRQHPRGMTMSGPYHRPSPLVHDASITTQASNARRQCLLSRHSAKCPEWVMPGNRSRHNRGVGQRVLRKQLHASHGRQARGATRNVCGTARRGDLHRWHRNATEPRERLATPRSCELRARVRRIEVVIEQFQSFTHP